MRRITYLVALSTVALAAPAAAQQSPGDTARVHVVRDGDTLWDLAGQYLEDPYLWPEIFSANQQTVSDPDRIFPEWRLQIPGLHTTGPIANGEASPSGRSAGPAVASRAGAAPVSRTVFFPADAGADAANRGPALVTESPEATAIVTRGAYLSAGLLVPDSVITPIGRLAEVISPTVVDRHAPPRIQPFDQVTMVVSGDIQAGDRIHLIRGEELVPPYGRIFVATGSARVLNVANGVATLVVDRFYDRIELGDIAVQVPSYDVRRGARPVPATGLDGLLLAFTGGEPVVTTEDEGFVNLGAASGVVEGDEFVAYLPAVSTESTRRPEIEVARLRVVRVAELTSAVRVIELDQPALEPGLPVRLVARMME